MYDYQPQQQSQHKAYEPTKLELEIEAKYKPALDAWETKAQAYCNANPIPPISVEEQRQAGNDLFDTLVDYAMPHYELIGKATTAGVNAFLTIIPTGLIVRASRSIISDLNKKNPAAARQLVRDIGIPLSEELIPRKIIELQTRLQTAWKQELLVLDAQD